MTSGRGSEKAYAYRWIVLSAFVLVGCMTQILWISFAPITSAAAKFYGTSVLNIGLLSMVFMVVYILVVLPSAWVIDTWGFKTAVGIGAVLSAVFALTRGIFASNFALVPDRHRRRPALRHRRHHEGGGPLVPDPGAGDGLRPWDAGPLPRPAGRHAPQSVPLPPRRHAAHAYPLRRGDGRGRRCVPRRGQGEAAHAGRAG
jgi:hypothetical protein